MRIAIIGGKGADTMESHLCEAFNYAGHKTEIFDTNDYWYFKSSKIGLYAKTLDKIARTYSDRYDINVFSKLKKRVLAYEPDLVVCVYRFIHPSFVSEIKKARKKIIHINPDALTTFEFQQVFASNYDAWFSKDPYIVRFMRNNMHLNAILYNEAFNIRLHKKPDIDKALCESEVGIDVMTYGTLYPYRARLLTHIIESGVDIKLFGVAPHRFYNGELEKAYQHKYITGEEKAKYLYGSKIVLNTIHYAEIESLNCRFFEVNGSGAFQLCDYRPILKDVLPIDPEEVSYKTIDEAVEKIKYYLNNNEKRIEIAEKMYTHFIGHFTYDHLVETILTETFR